MGNSNSGPRPRPTIVSKLHGVTRKDRLNPAEPKPPEGAVNQPESMSDAAKGIWDELAPVCLAMGTLTPADVRPFATLCELQATMLEASRQKDAEGFAMFTLSEDYNGAPKVGVHAAIKVERETASAIRPYYALFGLEPISRARIQVPKKAEEPVSKWAGALK
jgi:P27 family predicted phage terminase small subunit